jgi:hypothetical protein
LDFERTDVSEKRIASIIMVKQISELRIKLEVTMSCELLITK